MEQVNNCVTKNTRVLSMLGNCFLDWGGGKGFLRVGSTGSEFLCMALCVKSKIYICKVVVIVSRTCFAMNISANVLVCLKSSGWLSALGLLWLMILGVFRLACQCGCQLVGECGECVGHMGWSSVLPLGFPGRLGCNFCLFCFPLWLSGQEWV